MLIQADDEQITRGAQILRNGGLVAFPTETVYGLGANALDVEAVRRIYQVKQRPFASPLIVHVADEAMARSLSEAWPEMAGRLAQQFWPGPLTMVVKKAAIVPDVVTANLDSVAIRIPKHEVALKLIRQAGVSIAAPSANRFTEVSPTTAEHVRQSLGAAVDVILDGGPTEVGIESTVVSIWRNPPMILRPGMITRHELEHATGLQWAKEIDKPHIVESPGQSRRHYAPRTQFFLLEEGITPVAGRGRIVEMGRDPVEYARTLYSELRAADAEGWDWIAVRKPPRTEEWAGIWDRLERASQLKGDDA